MNLKVAFALVVGTYGYEQSVRSTYELRPLGETDITVKTGETFEIAFTSTKDINIEKDSYFKTPGGTELYLTIGNDSQFSWSDVRKGTEPEDDDRSYEWRVQWWRGSGSSDERTYGIRVTNCHELDHGHWEVKTKSGSNAADASEPASESDGSFNVTIVKPPANILLEPENINEFVANENGSITPIEITCIAEQCGPEPRFIWKIDDTILYDNNTEGSIMSRPGTRDFGVYNDYSQRITFQPETSMDAKRFSCNIEHEGYDATDGEDVKSTWFEIKVVGPPVPKEGEVSTESEVELKSGEEARLLVPFHSNPYPTNLSWVITDVGTLDENMRNIGRFHHEGWNKTNGTFYNGSRTWSSAPEHQYVAVLRVDNLKKSDQGDEHILRVSNPRGTTEYRVKIQHITKVLSGGEIAGIVIGVLAAIMLVAVVVILVIRRKNIRKAKIERDQRRRHRDDN